MTEILLAKPKLPENFIDLSVGEAYVVREIFLRYFDVSSPKQLNAPHVLEYPDPQGYEPLVQFLEDKYQAPVVICNGAKQGLSACFYAIKKMTSQLLGLAEPYWCLLPDLIKFHGLCGGFGMYPYNVDAYLAVAPSNPSGFMPDLECLEQTCKSKNIPLIHDGAYFSHIYLPTSYKLKVYGDAQIFSASKSFGLSGLRLGWIVCRNPDIYQYIIDYMEMMTVGVSIASQMIMYNLFLQMQNAPQQFLLFEQESANALLFAKQCMLEVNKKILDIPLKTTETNGMFGFWKTGPLFNQEKAKLNFIDGKYFGAPGYVRMNLALPKDQIEEVVRRLNASAG